MNLIVAKGAAALSALGLAFAAGAYLNRPKPCPVTKEVVKQSSDEGKKLEVKADIKDLVEVKPKVITIVKRVPVRLPGPGCPVAFEEETRTESTADSRIVKEASRQAAETDWKSWRLEHETTTGRDNWSLGAFVMRPASGILDFGKGWHAGLYLSRRLAGPFSVAAYGQRAFDGAWLLGLGLSVSM